MQGEKAVGSGFWARIGRDEKRGLFSRQRFPSVESIRKVARRFRQRVDGNAGGDKFVGLNWYRLSKDEKD